MSFCAFPARPLRRLMSLTLLVSLLACAQNPAPAAAQTAAPAAGVPAAGAPAAGVPAAGVPAAGVPAPGPSVDFATWRAGLRRQALAQGITAEVFDQAFSGLTPDPAVIQADRSQPEFTRPVWAYLDGALSVQRVAQGQQLLRQHAALLEQIERRYGVQRQVLVAIWGLESHFGQLMGNRSVIRSLATLAYEGRRAEFAQQQLLAALGILQQGDVQPARMLGSWAGAMGQTQFMPTTYAEHAVDFDADGRRDIWDSPADALASAARYLQASGWRSGLPWGCEVRLPAGFDYAQADAELRQPVGAWQRLGVITPDLPPALAGESASLLLPAGHRGPAFLVLDNFRAVLRYNNSTAYALAVGLLSQRFAGGGKVVAGWPRDDLPLSRSERLELQQRLALQGYPPGTPDSIIGANTRKAIRSYQQSLGWPADGYADQMLLHQLRLQQP